MQVEPITDKMIDRLVDGECTLEQQQSLLTLIANQPEKLQPQAWRHLALTFIESQAWSTHLREEFHRPLSHQNVNPSQNPNAVTVRHSTDHGKTYYKSFLLACASTVVLAVTTVFFLLQTLSTDPTPPNRHLVDAQSLPQNNGKPTSTIKEENRPTLVSTLTDDSKLRLTMNTADHESRQIEVPVVDSSKVSQDWMYQTPEPLSPAIQEFLINSGYRLNRQREIIPIHLKNGGTVMLPIDNYEMEYVGFVPQ